MTTEILIIGGGPAGCSAALFAAKAKRRVVLLHRGAVPPVSGLHWLLPGFPKETGPGEWLQNLRAATTQAGIEWVEEEVTQATLGASEKKITTASGKIFEVPALILASGCYTRKSFIEGEEKFAGHGVYYNAYQDGLWCEGQTLMAEGKTEQALREILYLSRFAGKIYFVVPAMRLEGDEKWVKPLMENPKIEVMLSASIKSLSGNARLEQAVVLSAGEEKKIDVDGVFLYARQSRPQYEFLKGTIEISEDGCVLVDDQLMTSIPGVFAAGDMLAAFPQLAFVSAAQGMAAALNAERWLANLNL